MITRDEEQQTYTYECDKDKLGRKIKGGSPVAACGFRSSGWEKRSLATRRGSEHDHEHESGETMTELATFLEGTA